MEQPTKASVSKGFSAKIIFGVVIGAVLLIVGVVCVSVFTLAKIDSFESCAEHYPVMDSYPERCRTPDGRLFTRQVP